MSPAVKEVTMKGQPLALAGQAVEVGQPAPEFTAVAGDMSEVKLANLRGKTVVIASVPSLDTSVCSLETKRFNESAAQLGDNVAVLVISMDLPFAQKRFCATEGIENVRALSDHRQAEFGLAYGVLIESLRLLARSVFVVDAKGILQYIEVVKEITEEPDYEAALAAVRNCS